MPPILPSPVTMLQLCQAGYFPPGAIAAAVQTIPPAGGWQCVWGPAEDSDRSNLAFVAAFYPPAGTPFVCVTIRGTDADIKDDWGIVEQVWEDMDFTAQVPLPGAPGLIAQGTHDALGVIERLTAGGATLDAFLAAFLALPANRGAMLLVNGHSLGGCLATVVAPWLQGKLAAGTAIVPYTFAAPSAGNPEFARWYETAFPDAARYHNALDVVPLAWTDISRADAIYAAAGIETPDLVYAAVFGLEVAGWLSDVGYRQPATGAVELAGVPCPTFDWYGQAGYQHHTTTYMSLLPGGTDITGQPPALCPAGRSRTGTLGRRLGPLPALLAKLHWLAKLRGDL